MKNAIQTIISIIRANPEQARLAITLDAIIGSVFALLVFVGLNAANISLTSIVVLGFSAALVLLAVGIAGYTVLYRTGYAFTDDEYCEED